MIKVPEAAIAACGNLAGKIVVDCTNPVAPDLSGLTIGHSDSASEAAARWAKGAKVIKALNTTGSGNMLSPRYGNETLSMFLCGDDADAKKLVTGLIAELGFEPVDASGLTQARYLEPLAMLRISMPYRYAMARTSATGGRTFRKIYLPKVPSRGSWCATRGMIAGRPSDPIARSWMFAYP